MILNNPSQTVSFKGKISLPGNMSVGMPQVSIFGPLFVITFINDLAMSVKNASFDMYTDDSTHTAAAAITTVEMENVQ